MNSGVIIKIEYRLKDSAVYAEIAFTAFSAKINQAQERTDAGIIYTTSLDFKIARCSDENDAFLKSLSAMRSVWRVTDANEVVHSIGTDQIAARLNFVKAIDGQPGNYNGYIVNVQAKSI